MNQWLRMGLTTAFDYGLALEMMTFMSEDAGNAIKNIKDKGPGAMPPE